MNADAIPQNFQHVTVLSRELVASLNLRPGDIAIDCTAGGGGHTAGLLEHTIPGGMVIALDRDPSAIANLQSRFASAIESGALVVEKTPFSDIHAIALKYRIIGRIRGICADIGVSSPQIDLGSRGFSFTQDGPLDMRMDTTNTLLTAHEVVNQYPERELTRIFRDYGEEPKAHFAARAIVKEREVKPIETTLELANLIEKSIFYKTKSRTHPATRIFQAIRIEVNDELNELSSLIKDAFATLDVGGRLAIITFHSLEDRIVKQMFREYESSGLSEPHLRGLPLTDQQILAMGHKPRGKIIKPFPILPTDDELQANPRSRSAKLRIIEKLSQH